MATKKRKAKRNSHSAYDHIPDDKTETLQLEYFNQQTLHVSTYKGNVTMHTPGEIVWLTVRDAERLGRTLIKSAKLQRRITVAEKAYRKRRDRDAR